MRARILIALGAFIASFMLVSAFRHGDEESRERASGYSGAKEALDFWTRARAYPDNDIPADKYYRAYRYNAAQFKQSGAHTQSSHIWQPLGPLNLNGRSLTAAVNPQNTNTIYLGSASGGPLAVAYIRPGERLVPDPLRVSRARGIGGRHRPDGLEHGLRGHGRGVPP